MKTTVATLLAAAGSAAAVTISEINGNKFISPYNGTQVTGVEGLVTAIEKSGIFLRSTEPDQDDRTSEGIYVFNKAIRDKVTVGDVITLDGKVDEYRSSALYSYLTEITSPTNVIVKSSNHTVKPLVLGVDTLSPPTSDFSSLDVGGIFGVPNDVNRISVVNPELEPTKYGLDFWESLVGQLVTLKDVVQVSRPNQYGDVWVRGGWKVTGINEHGGVTMLDGDANPETLVIGSPLDGSSNPDDTKMGDTIGDVTGIVYNAFGFYRILPLTAISPIKTASADAPGASFKSEGNCRGITFANYNARNLGPESKTIPGITSQIVDKMLSPDLIFLQEVLDGSGETDDGVVSGEKTLQALAVSIESASGVVYNYTEVVPIDKQDGGVPGGNIRQAYLYRPDIVELYQPNQGTAGDVNEVVDGPGLKYNPGRIDPANAAWTNSRKPLVAAWKAVKGSGKPFFTINVHQASKSGGSSSVHGDARPPINSAVDSRIEQAKITADFIAQILEKDANAGVIIAGDFNEFTQVEPIQVFLEKSGMLDIEDIVGIPAEERYTYLFDMNSQALDHVFISPGLKKDAQYEHLHLNTWQNYDDQVSDHDPSVAKLNVCGCGSRKKRSLALN
uniref:Endonuclease/exonuclease/phosphatase domain-containing protein n=1 Tax=Bionectria ochroleuca TaxID=29856 RepID=A0A8H7NEZ6_BIOOC